MTLLTANALWRKIFVFFLLLSSQQLFSQTIKGKVVDANSGEPLVGATVKIDGEQKVVFVKLDGTYSIKLKAGSFKVSVSYQGYKDGAIQSVSISGTETKSLNFSLESTANVLSSVTVNATGFNDGDKGARRIEKVAEPILNVLSAKTIQLLPDITVANALQRVSGVTIEKSGSGEGRYPIIRGMEKRYINTLVNGIKIPSPDNKNRYIPLDLFPSELLERLEVSKSLTPSMEGDAIGGTINLVMKDAPSKLLVQANGSLGFSSAFADNPYQKFDKSSMNKLSPAEIKGNTYTAVPGDFTNAHLNYTPSGSPLN